MGSNWKDKITFKGKKKCNLNITHNLMTQRKWKLSTENPFTAVAIVWLRYLLLGIFHVFLLNIFMVLSYFHVCLVTQLYPTLCDPMGCSPPGSSAHRISQARILEWVAVSFSRASSQPRDPTRVSYIGRRILHHWATREVQFCPSSTAFPYNYPPGARNDFFTLPNCDKTTHT